MFLDAVLALMCFQTSTSGKANQTSLSCIDVDVNRKLDMNTDDENDDDDDDTLTMYGHVLTEDEKELIIALANRSYHLPNHTLFQDLIQYFANNHPLLGICFHNKIHPINTRMRIVALIGSILCGLVISNLFVIHMIDENNNERYSKPIFSVFTTKHTYETVNDWNNTSSRGMSIASNGTTPPPAAAPFLFSNASEQEAIYEDEFFNSSSFLYDNVTFDPYSSGSSGNITAAATTTTTTTTTVITGWYITSGMLLLWIVGGSIHAMFDLSLWYIVACACCPFSKRYHKLGTIVSVTSVIALSALATLLMVWRAISTSKLVEDDLLEQHHYQDGFNDDILPPSSPYNSSSSGLEYYYLPTLEQDTRDKVVRLSINQIDYLYAYMVEFAMALLVFYPMGSLLLFSGLLGLGRLPILGGRPRDMWLEEQQLQKKKETHEHDKTKHRRGGMAEI